ncbi:hypothetical protein GDO81_020370 [Engystomops pustulosus]|uniref:DENN domain-containing protein 3 n=1 Tax=Engystomops pustulosus TaxID=76066 RepID=A0AAV6ZJT9_ENGPU|nr:hypothetical protein GDO81_020370 [Engystomops pustulosus]
MTQKRLFLLVDGRQSYEEIAIFRNIEEVKISTSAFLLLRIQTLRIKASTRKDVFEANLKSECELWQLMIKEMWAGRKMADTHKDPQYVQEALTNVLLMNAVIGALQTTKSIYSASKLSHFDKMKNEVSTIPMTTAETLKHRINPCAGETVPQSVDVLLYTPGQLDASLGDDCPKLWCALGQGKVVVFNASTWSLQQHCLKVGSAKLRCMVGVEQSQVWIGSSDSIIYIINTHSMSCNKQLNDHQGELVDIVVDSSDPLKSLAYSCSADGKVIVWDVSTLKIKDWFQLQYQDITAMKIYNTLLLYSTKDLVLVTGIKRDFCFKVEAPVAVMKIPSSCLQLFRQKSQLWVAAADGNEICVYNMGDFSRAPHKILLQDCSVITCMIRVKQQIWVGTKGMSQSKLKGKIYVIDAEKKTVEKELVAHCDIVKSLCSAEDRYVLSGSGEQEGKVAIWKVE